MAEASPSSSVRQMKRSFTIGIAGAHSNIGKTTLAAALLRYLNRNALSVTRNELKEKETAPVTHHASLITLRRWGAVKFTKTSLYTSLTDDPAVVGRGDKDTGRLLAAGAGAVLWVQSPAERLGEVLPLALDRLSSSGCDGILVEGNSAIEFLKPDIVIFISSVSKNRIKASAQRLLHLADVVIIPGAHDEGPEVRYERSPEHERAACRLYGLPLDEKTLRELADCMEKIMKKKSITELLHEKSADGRISCTLARAIAEELGVSPRDVGETADELKIKIKNCELGCF